MTIPYDIPPEEHRYIRRRSEAELVEQQQVSGSAPPVADVISITPQEFERLRKNFNFSEIEEARKNPRRTIADEASYFSTTLGHSRALTSEEIINVCQATFRNGEKVPRRQWLALRDTTFPFSSLSDSEREAIKDDLDKIIEYALFAGLYVLVHLTN